MQFGAGGASSAAAASSPSGKPALLLLTSTGTGGRGAGAGAGGAGGAGGRTPPPLSPGDVEATLLSAPGRPRARVSAAIPHGDSGAYVVALDLPSDYTGEVSVAGGGGGGSGSGGSGSGAGGSDEKNNQLSPLTFAVVRSPRVLVTASLPVE